MFTNVTTMILLVLNSRSCECHAEGSVEGFCERFPRKVIPEGRQFLRKVLAEGSRKVFPEGSAEGFSTFWYFCFCGRFCGRFRGGFCGRFSRKVLRKVFLRRVPRKVFAEGSRKVPGRFPEGFSGFWLHRLPEGRRR